MNKDTPIISVLMLTYNHASYIREAVDSVLSQETSYPFEVIIADDASTDGTREIIQEYAQKDSRIVLSLQKVNSKVYKNLIDACGYIRGKYLALCEGDDYWIDTYKLEKQVRFLEENPDFTVSTHKVLLKFEGNTENQEPQYIYKNCNSHEERIRQGIFYADEALANYYFQTGSLVLRWLFPKGFPEWIEKRMFFDHFMFMLHASEGKIKYFDEAMSVWRRHEGGYSWLQTKDKGVFFQKEGANWINLYKNIDEFFSYRYTWQIRERILLALRAMVENCFETQNYSVLKNIIDENKAIFNGVQKDAVLVDAYRFIYPEEKTFFPPWQSEITEGAVCEEQKQTTVGGFFELGIDDIPLAQNSVWDLWVGDKEYFGFYNAKTALMRALWEKGVTTIWLPAFIPQDFLAVFVQNQFIVKLYDINPKLDVAYDFLDTVGKDEAVLTLDYLGKPYPPEFYEQLAVRKDIVWVHDKSYSLDSGIKSQADIIVYSPKKLLGVPDGGILICDGAREIGVWCCEKDTESSIKNSSLSAPIDRLFSRYENHGYVSKQGLLQQEQDNLKNVLVKKPMSRLTESMLKRISACEVIEKRKQNWKILYAVLHDVCLWKIAEPDFAPYAFPLCMPAFMPAEILQTILSRMNIVTERMYWTFPQENNSIKNQYSLLAKELVLLPCDQRYTKEQMQELAGLVQKILYDPQYIKSSIANFS